MNISELVNQLVDTYIENGFKDEQAINNGSCADFASELADIINAKTIVRTHGYAIIRDDDELSGCEYSHTFVEYNGLFYDSETPEGTDDWTNLPLYGRICDVDGAFIK